MRVDRQFTTICPANGWFYTAKGTHGEPIAFPVAVWTVNESGDVIGLISATATSGESNVACLVYPPPIGGRYLHESQLSEEQREAAKLG